MEYKAPIQQASPSSLSFFTPPKGDLTRARYPIANQTALVSGADALAQAVQAATPTEA